MPGRSDIKAGAYVELALRNSAFLKGLRGSLSHLTSMARGFAVVGAAGIAAGSAIGGVSLRAFMATGGTSQRKRLHPSRAVRSTTERLPWLASATRSG